jgi:hypothetical protein
MNLFDNRPQAQLAPVTPRPPVIPPVQSPLQNPLQRPSLFAGAAQPSQGVLGQPRGLRGALGRLGSGIGDVLAGRSDPSLSDEQNKAARRQALMMSGLGMMAASAQRPDGSRPGLPEIFAQGAFAGQQTGQDARQGAHRQAAMQQMQEAFGSGMPNRETLQQLMVQLLLSGDAEGAKALGEVIKSMGDGSKLSFQNVGDRLLGIDPTSGQVVQEYPIAGENALERVDLGDRIVYHPRGDPNTVVASFPKGTTPDARSQQQFGNEQQLSQAYMSATADYRDVADRYATMEAASRRNDVPGDVALLYNYMRLLNPNMRLNEGTVATVENAGGVPDQIRATYNHLLLGKQRLTDSTRGEVMGQARSIAGTQRQQLQQVGNYYRDRATAAGIDPTRVIYDPFSRFPELTGGGAPAAPAAPAQQRVLPEGWDPANPFTDLLPLVPPRKEQR